jgi:FkbM family methyltransferase
MKRDLPKETPRYPGVITMPDFVQTVLHWMRPDEIRVVADVGAMDGGDTLALARAFPGARTIAVEGLQANFDAYLSWLPGVEAYCAVIGGKDGEARFFEKSVKGVHSLYERESDDTVRVHPARVETLVTFCRHVGIDSIDLLKIDVEGATLDVLEGLGGLATGLKALHVESEDVPFFRGQRLDAEVSACLRGLGFDMVRRDGRLAITGRIAGPQYDSVWIHRRFLRR